MAKSAGNYLNSQLIKVEAVKGGFAEGIALDAQGFVSEGSGENLFAVVKGRLVTPPLVSSILPGITRDTVITLARRLGLTIEERSLPREMLYLADELFFTGTAAEITPIRSVDRQTVGRGRRGPVTESLQKAFFDVIEGRVADEHGWLTFVPALAVQATGAR
jgi:branched-chain amino acid aminotransferase